jgi:hypothetical protein
MAIPIRLEYHLAVTAALSDVVAESAGGCQKKGVKSLFLTSSLEAAAGLSFHN